MFKEILQKEKEFFLNFKNYDNHINDIFIKEKITKQDFLKLLFNEDDLILEKMALESKIITDKFFGKTILLYAPLYISNYCENECVYCGFSALNRELKRKKLKLEEIEKEMIILKEKSFNTILLLTGDDRINSDIDYIAEAIKIAKKYFSEILIEIYALTYEEYKYLVELGLTGLTIYQETYDEKLYDKLHLAGPKKNFNFRLEAPDRAAKAGIKEINIGCLLGLNKNAVFDVYLTAIHADYLLRKYPDIEISISYPRIQPAEAKIKIENFVSDRNFLRYITATRIFLQRVGLNVSTREKEIIRDNLIGLGITKMSAGSKTTVGGYHLNTKDKGQFEISDKRSVEEIIEVIIKKGYRPEFTNWVKI